MSGRVGATCALLALAACAGCGGGDGDGDGAGATERSDQAVVYENPPMHARVEITPKGYRPKHTKILVGGSVTFVNLDESQSHTAETGELPGGDVTDNNEFDTHTLTWEEPYRIYFHKPERVRFHDSLSNFTGTVTAVPKFKQPEPPPDR